MTFLLLSSVTVKITRNNIHYSQCHICRSRREGTQKEHVVGMSYKEVDFQRIATNFTGGTTLKSQLAGLP
jgi:hypothetical protein